MNEIPRAMEELMTSQAPLPEADPISPETEQATLETQQMIEETNRAQALKPLDFEAKKEPHVWHSNPNLVSAPNADRTVGNGCTYSTINAASRLPSQVTDY